MAINNKTDTTATPYVRAQFPVYEEGVRRYIQDELQRIEEILSGLRTRRQFKLPTRRRTTHLGVWCVMR